LRADVAAFIAQLLQVSEWVALVVGQHTHNEQAARTGWPRRTTAIATNRARNHQDFG
jgi:hypothetical protein